MKTSLLAVALALALAACGGGGSETALDGSAARSDEVEKAKPAAAAAAGPLVAQPATRVNTATAGIQQLRSVGATADGGYTVAWLSGESTLALQRHDAAGNKAGGQVTVPLSVQGVLNPAATVASSALTVLADGSVAVAYTVMREQPPAGTSPPLYRQGVYIQRFDGTGALLLGETEVAVRVVQANSRTPSFGAVKAAALADGGFVVGWTDVQPSSVGIRTTAYHQRLGAQNQPVGTAVTAGLVGAPYGLDYAFQADAQGGYAVATNWLEYTNQAIAEVTHFDAANAATQVVAPRNGTAVLLPLEGERYVLFLRDGGTTTRQLLDGSGQPVGNAAPVATLPSGARELADGSFVTFSAQGGGVAAQRYTADATLMGTALQLATGATAADAAALATTGFVLAWSASGGGTSDLDVYAQRAVEQLDRPAAERRAQRKACQEQARGLKGKERKAFMDTCLR